MPKNKGHWPKGKRRNADTGDWQLVRLGIQAMIDKHGQRGLVSIRAIADAINVSDKTVRKWLGGTNRPSEENQDLLRAWLTSMKARFAKRKETK